MTDLEQEFEKIIELLNEGYRLGQENTGLYKGLEERRGFLKSQSNKRAVKKWEQKTEEILRGFYE